MEGFSDFQQRQDLENIKVISSKPGKKDGRQCQPFDYYSINYRGYIQDESSSVKLRQVLDSMVTQKGKPFNFRQGHYNVFKCWDQAVWYLRQGETVRIYCPAYLANGGSRAFSHLGLSVIQPNTPVYFDIEVLECQAKHTDLVSIGRTAFKAPTRNVVESGLKNFTGNNEYDASGSIKRAGGGPSPSYEDAVAAANRAANSKLNGINKNVDKLKKEADKTR